FKDTVIIMTSNAGSQFKAVNVGFEKENNVISTFENLTDYFKPEFLNRFDAIVTFNQLEESHLVQIFDLMLTELEKTIENNMIHIDVSEEAKKHLVTAGYDPRYGARPLRRVIQQEIEDKLTDLILEDENVTNVQVVLEEDQIVMKKA